MKLTFLRPPRGHRRLVAAWLGAAMAAAAASAADAPPVQVLACQACHGHGGISRDDDIPNLAGQKAEYLARQLEAFRDGSRRNDLMSAIAAQLDAQDIQRLAAYWSQASGRSAAASAAAPHVATLSPMVLPRDFPSGYIEYQRQEDAAGKRLSVKYANAPAAAAARAGTPLPDGSVILVVGYAAELDAAGKSVLDANGRMKLGKLLSFSGMESRSGWGRDIPALLRNGNWLHGLWTGEGASRLADAQPTCLACHKPKAADSYVFTLGELQRAVR
jgi:cytochrome c553